MIHKKIYPSSWPYWWVWRTPRVLKFGAFLVLISFGITYFSLAAINPRLFGNWGWNTIDHVSDRRAWHDYTEAQITAMAGSKHWLALGTTEQGITLLNKASRIPREHVTKGRVLDVTTGMGENEFLVLQGNQAIIALNVSNAQAQNIWLPKPTNPVWHGNFQPGIDIVNNMLDEQGWLVAVRNQGIARYLFGQLSNGKLYRKRSWQTGALSNVPLKDAFFTKTGIWMTLKNGGIRFADRTSLNEVSRRSIETPPIQRLESDYNGQWASAIDNNNSLWLYSENTGWAGPFFGNDSRCQLKALSDIKVAALHDKQVAWFGSDYGLFAYDLAARRIHCVEPDITVRNLIPLKSSNTILVTSNQGVKRVKKTSKQHFNTENLDNAPIRSASFSPDASLFVYVTEKENEVRALESPLSNHPTPTTVIPSQGWRHFGSAPRIVGIKNRGNDWLFATSEGAFLYNPNNHTYTDVSGSQSLIKNEKNKITRIEEELQDFTDLQQGKGGFTAIADNKLQFLHAEGDTSWINLDPYGETQATQLAHTNESIVGLEPMGEIYVYAIPHSSYSPPDIKTYLTGGVQNLQPHPLPKMGDIFKRTDGSWRVDFIHGNNLVNYESATGEIQEKPIPNELTENLLSQIRLIEDNRSYPQEKLLYLHSNGKILEVADAERNNLRTVFGGGSLSFAPETITAIAPSKDNNKNDVLLGSTSGEVAKYSWSLGSWENVTQQPIPESVVELQDTKHGIFVRTANNSLFRIKEHAWKKLDGDYWRWATTNSYYSSDIWAVGANGVARFKKSDFKLEFSSGVGMSTFVAKAIFAWQLDKTTVVFFSQGPQIGIYDTRTDTWKEQYFTRIRHPHQFIVTNTGELIVLDNSKIVRIDKKLNTHTLADLPFHATNPTIHWNGKSLQAAFIDNNQTIVLRVWDKLGEPKYHEYQGGGLTAGHFDPTQVVYAKKYDKSSVLLIDKWGEIAVYNYTTSQWQILRKAKPGQTVHSLLPARTGDNTVRLLLETEPKKTIVVPISEDQIGKEDNVAIPPDTVLEQREFRFPMTSFVGRVIRFFTQKKWTPIFLTQPGDKTLLETNKIRINRDENEQTHYQFLTYGQWHLLNPQPGGFSDDQFQDVALSSSGKLWALQSNRVINIIPTKDKLVLSQEIVALTQKPISMTNLITDQILLRYKNGDYDVYQDSQKSVIAAKHLATMNFAGYQLNWTWQPNGTIKAAWRYAQLPVWEHGSGGKLAIQAVQDIALTPDNKLLIASELGLQMRDSAYVLKQLKPNIKGNISFVRMYGPERILIKVDNHFAYEWNKGLSPLPSEPSKQLSSIVKSGPWNWQQQYPAKGKIAVFNQTNKKHRVLVTENQKQWRFKDDIVTWIIRKPSGELWLETQDGAWLFDIHQGRSSDSSQPTTVVPHENVEIQNKVIKISYSGNGGIIRFQAPDNGPVFKQGRFFFDNGEQMRAYKNDLYILVPNRGIIRRDSTNIGKITGFWPLPSNTRYSLKSSKNGVRLEANLPGNERRAWVLKSASANKDTPWKKTQTTEVRNLTEFGLIAWRFHNARIQPFLKKAQGFTRLSNWWRGDRFAWDKVICVGALNHNLAVLITPIGPVALQSANDGQFKMVDMKPNSLHNDINYCADARTNEGRHIGLIASNTSGSHQYLMTTNSQGTSAIKVQQINSSHLYRTLLKISHKEPHDIGISQTWENYIPSNVRNPAFIVELPNFSANNLLSNGQIIFDQANGATPIMSDTDMWAIFPDCQHQQCIIGINQIERGTDQTRLVLRDIWLPAFPNLQALKPSPEGGLFELYQNLEIRKRQPIIGNPLWDKVYPHEAQVREAFSRGEQVTLNVPHLTWKSQPLYPWDSTSPFATEPHTYNSFYRQGNSIAFSFDVITSIAMNKNTQKLAVGTKGGVFTFPYSNNGKQILKINNEAAFDHYNLMRDIKRVRYDGNLHIKLSNTENWLAKYAFRYKMSNDAWGIGRKPLSHIIDFVLDEQSETLWLGTRDAGVFKVFKP